MSDDSGTNRDMRRPSAIATNGNHHAMRPMTPAEAAPAHPRSEYENGQDDNAHAEQQVQPAPQFAANGSGEEAQTEEEGSDGQDPQSYCQHVNSYLRRPSQRP